MTFSRPCVPPRLCLCLGPPSSSTQQNCERHRSTFIHPVTHFTGRPAGKGVHPSFLHHHVVWGAGWEWGGEGRRGDNIGQATPWRGGQGEGSLRGQLRLRGVLGGPVGGHTATHGRAEDQNAGKGPARSSLAKPSILSSRERNRSIHPSNQPTSSIYFWVGVPSRPHTRTQTKARSRHSLQHKPRSLSFCLPPLRTFFFVLSARRGTF